ncbi:uncharacterized protein LOC103942681 [Pyrus x bretschneideri]|uniref:uncharacterized protein LOC103942681 n=1 Tax=Pyrus x bretschneideri TaxID=225117 RepID=UPI00202DF5FB|nr:uncharacterized protein LOC103942681 [Pyrus x bretschneideri]
MEGARESAQKETWRGDKAVRQKEMEGAAAAAAAAEGRHPLKPHPRFNNRNSWKHKDLIKSAFQDIVSAELEKIKESSLDENVRSSTSVPEANDMLWEYDGLTNVYQGDCEEILLEMQRIFYEDLTIHPTRKEETEICVETWEDEEDEYLSQAVYEHMQLNDKQV